jgi:sugar lactone lactonase YvrE
MIRTRLLRSPALPVLLALGACADDPASSDDTDLVETDTDGGEDTDETDVVTTACSDVATAPAGTICTLLGHYAEQKLTPEGTTPSATWLNLPIDMTVAPDGRLFFIDWNNHRVREIGEDGLVRTVVGSGFLGDGPEGPATSTALNHPTNITFDPSDPTQLYVAAWHNSRIERVDLTTDQLEFECGTGARAFGGDGGPAKTAKLDLPASIVFDDDGSILVSDAANQLIRRIDPEGVIDTVAGTLPTVSESGETTVRATGWSGDGGPALSATFNFGWGQKGYPAGRIHKAGRTLYVADSYNHVVRKIDLDTWQIDHVAGTGLTPGVAGDGGAAATAQLNFPTDVDVDAAGNLYIADTFNHCVRKVDTEGTITTVAGVCGEPGADGDEGMATDAHLFHPYGIALGNGLLYIADTDNQVIRAVKL